MRLRESPRNQADRRDKMSHPETTAALVAALKDLGFAVRVRDLGSRFRVCLKTGAATTRDERTALAHALNSLGFCSPVGKSLDHFCFNGAYEVCVYFPERIRQV